MTTPGKRVSPGAEAPGDVEGGDPLVPTLAADEARITSPLPIAEALPAVRRDFSGIAKAQQNKEHNYKFRGIEDILTTIGPLLGKHGLTFLPSVLERIAEQRATRSGGTLWTVHLHVRWRIMAADGSFVETDAWGEGTDVSDKATNKAMTSAFKFMLGQVFSIGDDATDTDQTSEESSPVPAPPQTIADLLSRAAALPAPIAEEFRTAWRKSPLPTIRSLNQSHIELATQLLTEAEEKAAKLPTPTPPPPHPATKPTEEEKAHLHSVPEREEAPPSCVDCGDVNVSYAADGTPYCDSHMPF